MTFPLQTIQTGSSSVSYPATVVAGSLILLFYSAEGVDWTSHACTGLTKISGADRFNTGSGSVFYKIADGTEGGTTLSPTGGSNPESKLYVITGWWGDYATGVTFNGWNTETNRSTFDPPSVTASWGAADNKFIACAMSNQGVINGNPSDYNASSGSQLGTAWRDLASASDNPGLFSTTIAASYVAATLVVRGLPGVASGGGGQGGGQGRGGGRGGGNGGGNGVGGGVGGGTGGGKENNNGKGNQDPPGGLGGGGDHEFVGSKKRNRRGVF